MRTKKASPLSAFLVVRVAAEAFVARAVIPRKGIGWRFRRGAPFLTGFVLPACDFVSVARRAAFGTAARGATYLPAFMGAPCFKRDRLAKHRGCLLPTSGGVGIEMGA